jgi:hypothetical protein
MTNLKEISCNECGDSFYISNEKTATVCPFCGAEFEESGPTVYKETKRPDIIELAAEIIKLDDEIKVAEKKKGPRLELRKQLGQVLIDLEMQGFKYGGKGFFIEHVIYPRVPALNRDAVHNYLRENGYADLIYETVNAQRFKSFFKELRKENGGETPKELDELITVEEYIRSGMKKSN